MTDERYQPLACAIEGGQLVIRIGLATLAHAAENCHALFHYARRPNNPYCKVVDQVQLAQDVRGALLREDEEGTTDIHRLLDIAIVTAWEEGTAAFADDEGGES